MYLKIEELKNRLEVEVNEDKFYYDMVNLETFEFNSNTGNHYYLNYNKEYLYDKVDEIIDDKNKGEEILVIAKEYGDSQAELIDLKLVSNQRVRELVPNSTNSSSKKYINEEKVNKILEKFEANIDSQIEKTFEKNILDDYYFVFKAWVIYLLELKKEEDLILEYLTELYDEIIQRINEVEKIEEKEPEKESQEEQGFCR